MRDPAAPWMVFTLLAWVGLLVFAITQRHHHQPHAVPDIIIYGACWLAALAVFALSPLGTRP